MSDQKDKSEIVKKLEKIYENFGLDMDDMDSEEVDRIVDYYDANKSQLEKDFKSSSKARKTLDSQDLDDI